METTLILQLFPNWNHQQQEHFDTLVMEKNMLYYHNWVCNTNHKHFNHMNIILTSENKFF